MFTPKILQKTICVVLVSCIATFGATITVGPGGGYDYTDIQSALTAANNGDTVDVYSSTYSISSALTWSGKHLTVKSHVAGGAIIDGQAAYRGFYLYNSGQNSSDTIDGFVFQDCYTGSSSGGAGILCYNVSPNITNCDFNDCDADNAYASGGGVCFHGVDGAVSDCLFLNCTAASFGGGVYFTNCDGEVQDCVFSNCSASQGGAVSGEENLTVTDCTIDSCYSSYGHGGGIYHESSYDLSVDVCMFSYNSAPSSCSGGAIFVADSTTPSITNSVFQDNSAEWGGAVYSDGTDLYMRNCTVVENGATLGGGLYMAGADVDLISCIFWGNSASSYGDQGYFSGAYDGYVEYCDVADKDSSGFYTYGSYTITWGSGNIDSDPDFSADGYHLDSWNSPCIDTGKPSTGAGETDIDGQTRVNPNTRGQCIDIGADEKY